MACAVVCASIRRFPTTTIACSRGSFRKCWHASSLVTARPPRSIGRTCTTGNSAGVCAEEIDGRQACCWGGCAPLPRNGAPCCIAEGIETSLAAAQLFRVPVWSCISTSGLQSFEPPEGVGKLLVFGDNDTNFAGQTAAHRLKKKGLVVTVKIPSTAGDWLDQLREGTGP